MRAVLVGGPRNGETLEVRDGLLCLEVVEFADGLARTPVMIATRVVDQPISYERHEYRLVIQTGHMALYAHSSTSSDQALHMILHHYSEARPRRY